MALFTTDFTEYTTGVQPADWTRRFELSGPGWTVEDDATSPSGRVLRFGQHTDVEVRRRGLSWDDIDADTDRDDVEILLRVRALDDSSEAGSVPGALARGSGTLATINAYVLSHRHQPANDDTEIILYDAGSASILDSLTQNIALNVWYFIRAQVIGTTLRARTWLINDPEPATWAVEISDSTIAGVGWVGTFSFGIDPYDISLFSVGTNGDPVPIPIITGAVELDLEVEVDVVGRAGASIEIQLAGVVDLDVSPLVQISIEMLGGGGTIDAAGFRPLPSRTIFTTAIELWSDLRVAGGERIAILSDFESVLAGTYRRTIDRDDELEITIPVDSSKLSLIELEMVIRVDDGFHPATWWRLKERRDGRGIGTGTVTLVGKSVHTELSRALIKEIPPRGGSLRIRAKGQRFVSEWLSAVIFPALELEGIDWVVLNQNDFANVFLEFDIPNATALLLLNEIETAVGGEWSLTDAGEFFALDLVREIGVGTPERLISFGRNLLHITDDLEHGQTYGTVIVPTGAVDSELGPATVAENAWEIESRSGDVVVLVDPAGGDGPAQFDDQFSPPGVVLPVYHLYTSIFGVIGFPIRRDILDTVVLDARRTQLTVDDASGLSAGDIVRIDPIPELIGVP